MLYGSFVIYDRVAGVYAEPFLANNVAAAQRKFNSFLSGAPMVADDCELYHIGDFDNITGVMTGFEKPVFICKYERAVTNE